MIGWPRLSSPASTETAPTAVADAAMTENPPTGGLTMQPTDPLAALAARVAALEKDNAGLAQRLSDEADVVASMRRLVLVDDHGIGRVTLAVEQRDGRHELILRDLHGGNDALARYALHPSADDAGAQAARAARDGERGATLKALQFAETPANIATTALEKVLEAGKIYMPSDAEPVRRALPRLEAAIAAVRALMEREPWPEAAERLRARKQGEALLADARAALAKFDERMAEQERARRRRLEAAR